MKTLLIEAIPLLRDALIHQLSSFPLITSVQSAADIPSAFDLCTASAPELLWLDGTLLDGRPEQIIQKCHKAAPKAQILLFGHSSDSILEIKNYFKQGIRAYLPKTAPAEDIFDALNELAAGHLYIPPSLHRAFASWLTDPVSKKKKSGQKLTPREKEILDLIVEENTGHEIASKLFISQCTVETHRINLIQKLGVKNTAGLVRVACEAGLYQRRGV